MTTCQICNNDLTNAIKVLGEKIIVQDMHMAMHFRHVQHDVLDLLHEVANLDAYAGYPYHNTKLPEYKDKARSLLNRLGELQDHKFKEEPVKQEDLIEDMTGY